MQQYVHTLDIRNYLQYQTYLQSENSVVLQNIHFHNAINNRRYSMGVDSMWPPTNMKHASSLGRITIQRWRHLSPGSTQP